MTTTPSERLRKILNERLPELLELRIGLKGITPDGKLWVFTDFEWRMVDMGTGEWGFGGDFSRMGMILLGHNASIYDIVRALGERYSITAKGEILQDYFDEGYTLFGTIGITLDPSKSAYEQEPAKIEEIIKLFN